MIFILIIVCIIFNENIIKLNVLLFNIYILFQFIKSLLFFITQALILIKSAKNITLNLKLKKLI